MDILTKNTHTCNEKHFVFSWKDVKKNFHEFSQKKFQEFSWKDVRKEDII